MANDLNSCNFIGRLGKDPTTKYTQGGKAVTSFSIACGWKSKDKEGVEWINVTAFDKLGEVCGEYLSKGKQVFVSGRFTTDKYEKDGIERYSTKIVADRVQFLGSKDDAGSQGGAQQSRGRNQGKFTMPEERMNPPDDFSDDDIPF